MATPPGSSEVAGDPGDMSRWDAVLRGSRYAQRLLAARPDLARELRLAERAGWDRDSMQIALDPALIEDAKGLAHRLRDLRMRVMLRLITRDLAGLASLQEVLRTMSALAEVCLASALAHWTTWLEAEFGTPMAEGERQGLIIIGMGKLGGGELNVSSDIDLIFVYPRDGQTDGRRSIDNASFFQRLGQRIIAAIDEPTGDGRVFRVDMRLRPWGDGGPLATSLDALDQYFVVHGREWERYAWMKAKVVAAGPLAAKNLTKGGPTPGNSTPGHAVQASHDQPVPHALTELAQSVREFVYRRYLDYDAIGALRSLHSQIRSEVRRRDLAEHVKLGAGGIREIEFIVQAQQIVRAGRDKVLQLRPTIAAIDALVARNVMAPTVAQDLLPAYEFLRRLEHRLQYLDDAQTHQLPTDPADRLLIAQTMGYAQLDQFEQALAHHRQRVEHHFSALFGQTGEPASASRPSHAALSALWHTTSTDEQAQALLAELGFGDPHEALRRLHATHSSARYRSVPATSQSRIDALIPWLIESCSGTALDQRVAQPVDPGVTLARMLNLVEAVAGRSAYLALLTERRDVLERIAGLMAASSWAANYLIRHPALLDEIILPRAEPPPDAGVFATELQAAIGLDDQDTEVAMDVMREQHHAQVFRLLVRDLSGSLELERLSDHLSALAEGVLEATVQQCWARLASRHREVPRFAVIAYGKLGGKELGYASDLDLAFLFDDPDPRAAEIYSRLAQRVVTWLSSRTAAGLLFETDLRLRPNGEAGLIVTSIEAFRRYQEESAWLWEHQAITRARACAGDRAIGEAFEAERMAILYRQRDPADLIDPINTMRERIDAGHPNRSGLFDLKHSYGGMVDIEFTVQALVLGHAHANPQLAANIGNIALLQSAGALGLADPALCDAAANAYRELRRLQHHLRLNDEAFARIAFERVAPLAQAGRALWSAVLGPRRAGYNSGLSP